MLSCIVGALLACGSQPAAMHIAGPLAYAPQGGTALAYYALPTQYVPPVIIIRRA
jgi:hypothetical protein